MAAASTEAFINEIAEHIAIYRTADWADDYVTPEMAACAEALAKLEGDKAQVPEKYLAASKILSGKAFPKSAAPFQDFATLTQLRNAIMHVKPATRAEKHLGTKITDALGQRRIATPNPAAKRKPGDAEMHFAWFNRLEVPKVADWAFKAARDIEAATLALIPIPQPGFDAMGSMRWAFENNPVLKVASKSRRA